MTNRQRLIIPILAGSVLVTSCGEKSQEASTQAYPVVTVARSAVEVTEDYPATIRGRQDIEIYPQVSGKIMQVAVSEGQRVRKGQTLFVIDQVPYKAALQTAAANVESARAAVGTARLSYEGKLELFEQSVISQFELSTAENALLTAQAQLAQYRPPEKEEKPASKSARGAFRAEPIRPMASSSVDDQLLDALKQLRKQLAAKENHPAYHIFTDAALEEMVRLKPVTLDDFSLIHGVGQIKLDRYGRVFVALIRFILKLPKMG